MAKKTKELMNSFKGRSKLIWKVVDVYEKNRNEINKKRRVKTIKINNDRAG